MPITIDATLAAETSNSYVTVAFADDYFDNHWDAVKKAAWAAITSDDAKANLLVQACRVIETLRFTDKSALPEYALHYNRSTRQVLDLNLTQRPVRYYYYQRLQFPRNLDIYKSGVNQGQLYIPSEVQWAQCEQAIYMLTLDTSAMANRLQGITLDKVTIGRGQIETTQEYAVTGSMFSPVAYELLRPYAVKSGRAMRG